MSTESLLDQNGHLTASGLAALRDAPAGGAPQDVAAHIAACATCQEKLLVASSPGPRPKPGRKPHAIAPSPARTAVLVLITLGFILVALMSLRKLVDPGP